MGTRAVANIENRRQFERFALRPMYTPIVVQPAAEGEEPLEGHAYDIGEGGVRFELDRAIAPGTPAEIVITLPGAQKGGAQVSATGNIIWLDEDPDEPGPAKMALAFTKFEGPSDRARLLAHLASGRFRRAA